jgi:hypothetical protein
MSSIGGGFFYVEWLLPKNKLLLPKEKLVPPGNKFVLPRNTADPLKNKWSVQKNHHHTNHKNHSADNGAEAKTGLLCEVPLFYIIHIGSSIIKDSGLILINDLKLLQYHDLV